MSVIDTLITDRNQTDINALDALEAKIKANTATVSEVAEYALGRHRAGYNATDMNRVGSAIRYLADTLNTYGYSVTVNPKTDYAQDDGFLTPEQLDDYLEQVKIIRGVILLPPETPDVPPDMLGLTLEEANDIERILVEIDTMLQNMKATWVYSGEVYAGEV